MEITSNQSKSSVARSFRLPENWDKMLDEEAKKRGVTVSSLLTQMVRKHLIVDSLNENLIVTLPVELFRQFISRIDSDSLSTLVDYCRSVIASEIFMRGMNNNLESALWVLDEVFGNYYGWYKLSNHEIGKERRLYFQHSFGEEWSRFLKIFLESFFKEISPNVTIEDDKYHVTARVNVQ